MCDKDCLVKFETYKESGPGGYEFRDNSSDFHGKNAPVQYGILVNEGESMGNTYAVSQICLFFSGMMVCITFDYYISLKLQNFMIIIVTFLQVCPMILTFM